MQSGSDGVLRRMRRRWGSRRFVDRCRLVEGAARPAGDHDRHHRRLPRRDRRRVCRDDRHVRGQVGFSKIHIFPFSPRRGTPAATMPDQVPAQVQQERSRELAAVEMELRDEYFDSLRGMQLQVLVESKSETGWLGTSCRYAPVELATEESSRGRISRRVRRRPTGRPSVGIFRVIRAFVNFL